MISDINPGSSNSLPGGLTEVNGTLYFTASDGIHGKELWAYDIPPAGSWLYLPRLVK